MEIGLYEFGQMIMCFLNKGIYQEIGRYEIIRHKQHGGEVRSS